MAPYANETSAQDDGLNDAVPAEMRRLLTALFTVPLLVLIVLRAPTWIFTLIVTICGLLGFWEFSRLSRSINFPVVKPLGYIAVCAFILVYHEPKLLLPLLFIIVLAAAGTAIVWRETTGRALGGIFATLFGITYTGTLLGSLIGVRLETPEPAARYWVLFLLAVIMLGDTAAFYVGKALGRHRLAPHLSPKKTLEGLAGGIVGSGLAALGISHLLFPTESLPRMLALGLVLSVVGVFGDLFESFLKRTAGVKDTSSLVPGHGGILDRLDSLLFATPVLYIYLTMTH